MNGIGVLLLLFLADIGSRLFEFARLLSIDSDATTQKTAVTVLSRMVVGRGDEVMEQVLSTLLSLPLTPHFSFKDAASQLVSMQAFLFGPGPGIHGRDMQTGK